MAIPVSSGTMTAEVLHRVGGQALQGVDLLGDHHGAQLGRHGRANPAGHHEPGDHRGQFAHHRQPLHLPGQALGLELLERERQLHREHHADRQRGEHHHRNRVHPDSLHLEQQIAAVERPLEDADEATAGNGDEISGLSDDFKDFGAKLLDQGKEHKIPIRGNQ
jgi:hypothetical protein